MENSVIIVIVLALLCAWIAWLVYNYSIYNKQVSIEAKVDYWKGRVSRIQNCLDDLILAIHKQFPKSTIEYNHTPDADEIGGEIKY